MTTLILYWSVHEKLNRRNNYKNENFRIIFVWKAPIGKTLSL